MSDIAITKKERLAVFDVAKGLGILLVVFAHINYTNIPLVYIYSFHMPLFFLISGIFFDTKKYTFPHFIKNKFLNLICPYLFFYTCILLVLALKYIITDGFATAFETFKQPFIQMFIAQSSGDVISAPLWFIPCLFVVEVLYYFISKFKIYLIIPICIALVVGGWVLETYFTNITAYLPWSIDSALFSIGFYAIGNLTSNYLKIIIKKVQENKYRVLISLTVALACFAIIIPFVFLNGKVSLGSKMLNNGFLFYLTGIIGSIGIIALSNAITNCKFLSYLGRNTFCIMAVHHFINGLLKKAISVLGFTNYDITNFFHTIFPFLIVLGLSIVCVIVYNFVKSKLKLIKKKKA